MRPGRHVPGKLLRLGQNLSRQPAFQSRDFSPAFGTKGEKLKGPFPAIGAQQSASIRTGKAHMEVVPFLLGQFTLERLPKLGGKLVTPLLTGLVNERPNTGNHVEDRSILVRPTDYLVNSFTMGVLHFRLVVEAHRRPRQRLGALYRHRTEEDRQILGRLSSNRVRKRVEPCL